MTSDWGWSFRDKTFFKGLAISLLWHAFWFFSVVITINPHAHKIKTHPQIVSLGPVLDDTIFRTLVESKPEAYQAFYRRLSDFKSPAELEVKTLERLPSQNAPEAVLNPRSAHFVREALRGEKASPVYDRFADNLGGLENALEDPEYLRYRRQKNGDES